MQLSNVDLPALGRPINETNPAFMDVTSQPQLPIPYSEVGRGNRELRLSLGGRGGILASPRANLGDPATLDFEHLERELVQIDDLADVRHAAQGRQQIPADGFEPLTFDLDP